MNVDEVGKPSDGSPRLLGVPRPVGELRVFTFEGYTREWAEFIFLNRNNRSTKPAHDYDIVYGPIANDRVGVQIGKYEAGDITLDQFLENLQYMKGVTFQYFFGTERALAKLSKI